jgi:hypothetical protein
MINFEEQRTVRLHHKRPWVVGGHRHQRCRRLESDLGPFGVGCEESGGLDSVGSADGVGDSEGVGVAVGSGRVTINVGELRL